MYKKIKRLLDIILALAIVISLMPVILLLIIGIKIDSKGPVFFKQKRVGKNKQHFNILKFRTMKVDTPGNTPTHLLENPEAYITRVGKFLRRTSLDELPQVWNILIGDMSFIGPRPALWNQYDLIFEREQFGIHSVPPGLSGWAQINGRDELSINEKVRLDKYYVNKFGVLIDVKCFIGTFIKVLKSDGVIEGEKKEKSCENKENQYIEKDISNRRK